MTRQKTDARLLCYASIIALSMTACTHSGKLKNGANLTDNTQQASTSDEKKSRASGRWLSKKNRSLASSGRSSSASQYDSLWDRLFDLYDLPPIEHQDIDREFSWFLNHPSYIERVQQRAEPFLYSIVRQVEKHDIPGEIALLPVIESAFQPQVVSPANAAGIWQFIPSTGRMYGLKKSRYYDGRRDIYASTRAAIKYLKKLHRDFNGDWLLAIAAYNCGEGAVGRAIQRNMNRGLPTDFWSLDLPQETRTYVPRLLAVSKLFVEADQHGIDLRDIPNHAQFKAVKVKKQVDLALAANAANISLEQLYALNPGFRSQHTDLNGSFHLYIPAHKKADDFRAELDRLIEEDHPTNAFKAEEALGAETVAYAPSSEDTPTDSAESAKPQERTESNWTSFKADPEAERAQAREEKAARQREAAEEKERKAREKEAARQEREREAAREEEKREAAKEREREAAQAREEKEKQARHAQEREKPIGKHPSKESDKGHESSDHHRSAELAKEDHSSHDIHSKKGTYIVQPGETLWAVARKHSVDVSQLAKWNNFSEQTRVQTGQSLVVWNKDAGKKLVLAHSGIRPTQSIKSYTVKPGDTLFSISKRFNVSMADLRKWNGSNVEKQIQPGKNITVQHEKN